MNNNFKPAWWLPDGHSQTLWRKFSPPSRIKQDRQRIELADGDFIDVDWEEHSLARLQTEKEIVLIFHGLCGCSESPYVAALQALLADHNIPSVAMNFRSCSGEVNRLARAYHSGVTEDANEVFESLSQQYPQHSFSVVGYSLGANVLLKWLGEMQSHPRLRKAVAVSTPFSLANCSRAMLQGMSKVYGKYFVRRLTQEFQRKQQHFKDTGNVDEMERIARLGELDGISSIWEFDDKITAPLHGFANADDYYSQCSSIHTLGAIRTETLLIQSANDPMIPSASLPNPQSLPDNIQFELSVKGGHVGFISGKAVNWLERRIVDFIAA